MGVVSTVASLMVTEGTRRVTDDVRIDGVSDDKGGALSRQGGTVEVEAPAAGVSTDSDPMRGRAMSP